MSDKKTKRCFYGYFPFDYKAFEQELREQLAAGWMLSAFNRFSVVYTRTENTSLTPFVDVFTGAYESDGEKKLSAYRKKRKNKGWIPAGEMDFFYVWYLPEEETVPESAPEAERNLNQRMVWSKELSVLGIAAAILVLGLVAAWKLAYTDFLTFTGVGSLSMFPLFIIPCVVIATLVFRDVAAAKKPLQKGLPLAVPTVRDARRRYRLIWGLALVIAVYIALLFILDGLFGYSRYLTLLLPVVVAALAVWGLQKVQDRRTRRLMTFMVVAVCGVLLFGLQAVNPFDMNRAVAPEDMSVVLTLDEKPASTAYRQTVSPMVPEHYTYTQTGEGKKSAQNEYFRIPADFCRRIVLGEVLDALETTGEVEERDASAWDAERLWQAADGSVLILRGSEIFFYKATDAEGNAVAIEPADVIG